MESPVVLAAVPGEPRPTPQIIAFAANVDPALRGIRQQFIQNPRKRQSRLFRQRPGGRFVIDRYSFAKGHFGISA
jgi:hypothetical protein